MTAEVPRKDPRLPVLLSSESGTAGPPVTVAAPALAAMSADLRHQVVSASVDDAGEVTLLLRRDVLVIYGTVSEIAAKATSLDVLLSWGASHHKRFDSIDVTSPNAPAATLASGFVVSPAVSAVGEALGLDFLELEPTGSLGTTSFRLSAGREIWKGLFVTYAREFSAEPYNEFLAEYELTRYLRVRANASDVSGVRSRASLFRRIERAGIDLIFFFSY